MRPGPYYCFTITSHYKKTSIAQVELLASPTGVQCCLHPNFYRVLEHA